jgi:hypothetical protein
LEPQATPESTVTNATRTISPRNSNFTGLILAIIKHLGAEILLNLSNEEVYIPDPMEGAFAATDQGEQLVAVEVGAIRHLRPIVVEVHFVLGGYD